MDRLLFIASLAYLAHKVRLHLQANRSGSNDGAAVEMKAQAQPMLYHQGPAQPAQPVYSDATQYAPQQYAPQTAQPYAQQTPQPYAQQTAQPHAQQTAQPYSNYPHAQPQTSYPQGQTPASPEQFNYMSQQQQQYQQQQPQQHVQQPQQHVQQQPPQQAYPYNVGTPPPAPQQAYYPQQ